MNPGHDNWTTPLITIDIEFVDDVINYIDTIKDYKMIKPMRRRLLEPDEKVRSVLVFHDASVSTIGVIIYLHVEGKTGGCLLYTSPSPRDRQKSRMPSSA